jgi:hypothetical protein
MSRKATEEEKASASPVVETSSVTPKAMLLWTVLNTRQFYLHPVTTDFTDL